jgi:hypothetical protein
MEFTVQKHHYTVILETEDREIVGTGYIISDNGTLTIFDNDEMVASYVKGDSNGIGIERGDKVSTSEE